MNSEQAIRAARSLARETKTDWHIGQSLDSDGRECQVAFEGFCEGCAISESHGHGTAFVPVPKFRRW